MLQIVIAVGSSKFCNEIKKKINKTTGENTSCHNT